MLHRQVLERLVDDLKVGVEKGEMSWRNETTCSALATGLKINLFAVEEDPLRPLLRLVKEAVDLGR